MPLTRPDPAPDAGPLDDRFYDLVEARVRRVLHDNPAFASSVGVHTEDHRLGDATRDAVHQVLGDERAHVAAIETLDEAGLSLAVRFERELEIHNLRLSIFEIDVQRNWERRSTAIDEVGHALFALFARDFAPLAERLGSITARIETIPLFLDQHRTRATVPQVRLWQELEIESAGQLPGFLGGIVRTGQGVLGEAEQARLERATDTTLAAIDRYAGWLRGSLATATEEWALGHERLDELVRLRELDGLDADAILEIGEEELARNTAARIAAAREIDPSVDEPIVRERIRRDGPGTFEEALEGYRSAMYRARQFLIDRDIATVPPDEHLIVTETPVYQRNVFPTAAYFDTPKFDRGAAGIYVVTPPPADDPNAMREHCWGSISNTSIHEAYPGHHLQATVAGRHPSLTRFLTEAPEFHEGWAMYGEQMMREEGFDDTPSARLTMYTDAIWRACRIVLDIRMHRGEIGVDDAVGFLTRHTGMDGAVARAEVARYTYTPAYQLSYLLGKVLLLQLRDEQRRRLGASFSLKRFHDALLVNGGIPVSFHRRLVGG